jgi:TonB family protein
MKAIIRLMLLLMFGLPVCVFAAGESTNVPAAVDLADSIYHAADKMPEPVGGMTAIYIKVHYPEKAIKSKKEGKVLVAAVVDANGDVIKVSIKNSTDRVFDATSKDAVKRTKFTPALKNGKPVKSEIVIPIQFKLDAKGDLPPNEEVPYPIGGMEAIMKSVRYPESAKNAKIEGKVIVQGVVDENGDVVETTIFKSVSPELDAEAMRALRSVKFTPGRKDGKATRVKIFIPIMFKLD